jgi:hypothetical protein
MPKSIALRPGISDFSKELFAATRGEVERQGADSNKLFGSFGTARILSIMPYNVHKAMLSDCKRQSCFSLILSIPS